jgi:hypothetical protein
MFDETNSSAAPRGHCTAMEEFAYSTSLTAVTIIIGSKPVIYGTKIPKRKKILIRFRNK